MAIDQSMVKVEPRAGALVPGVGRLVGQRRAAVGGESQAWRGFLALRQAGNPVDKCMEEAVISLCICVFASCAQALDRR